MACDESGYSLIELVVVITTIIVILACALPRVFVSLSDYRLHSDASEISGYLFRIGRPGLSARRKDER